MENSPATANVFIDGKNCHGQQVLTAEEGTERYEAPGRNRYRSRYCY